MTLQAALPANAALIPADALRVGTRLDNYEIDGVVARSAVAMVYRAQDRTANQAVAIKEFLPTGLAMRGDDGQVVAREANQEQNFQHGRQVFLDEAKALAKCEHACLMPVLRVMECHGTVYKVMPYCPGPTLLEHRQKMPTAPTDRLLRKWLEGLLGALAELHQRGLVHAAVSPGNILLLPDGRPLLLDSDAVYAAILSDRTRSMIAALEPCFAPPEQCDPAPAKPLGPWTDLYSLAATLQFCASGQLPGAFAQRPRGGRFESAGRPQAISDEPAGRNAPPWLKALDACLADATTDRPQDVAQLKRLLGVERPKSPAAMGSATAGLAPMLSSPVPKSPAWAVRPVPFLPERAGQDDAAPDVQDPPQVVRQAPHGAAQLSLPLVLEGAAVAARVEEPDADSASQAYEANGPPDAAHSVSPGPAAPAKSKTPVRSRLRLAGALGSLLVVAIAAVTVSLVKEQARPIPDPVVTSGPAQSRTPSIAQPSAVSEPVPTSTSQAVARADISAVARTNARAETRAAPAAAPVPLQRTPAALSQPRKPAAAKVQGQPPSAAKARAGESSPRQTCAGKERYALLQCMETLCAKKAWTKHEQCVRLRRDRRL